MADVAKGIAEAKAKYTFEKTKLEYYPDWGFRPQTQMFPIKMNFIFLNGGMGDYITWLTPIRWLASEATWIEGSLVVPNYFVELAEYFLKPFPKWKVQVYDDMKNPQADTTPFRGPVILQQESLNATGAHLITCGWVYFTNKEGPPAGIDTVTTERTGIETTWDSYSQFTQSDLDAVLAKRDSKMPERYAVITTGITTPSRAIPAKYWNYVIEYVHSLGITPVFLGKSLMVTGNAKNIHTEWGRETRYDLGVDLRDKTSLIEATAIMSRAEVVIGHDNGLLHLAGCTQAPIVFGYNLASPQHREPRRPRGRTINVHLDDSLLKCNFCQSKVNFLIGYNFRECMYNDTKCIHLLFENGAERWKRAIDEALRKG